MSTLVKTTTMVFPYSLGKISPAGAFATVCVPLTQNITPVKQDGAAIERRWREILISSFAGDGTTASNTGPIFICNSAAAPDLTNYTNVIAILQPGDVFPRSSQWAAELFDVTTIYIGATNATDFALASICPL